MSNPNPPLENLKSWQKGQSGNPAGKHKGTENSATRLMRLLKLTNNLQNPITGEIEGFTVLEQLDLAQIIKARAGNTKSYEVILERLEGKPKETSDINLTGKLTLVDLVKQVVKDKENGQPQQE